MGLDMYAYVAARAGQSAEFHATAKFDPKEVRFVNPNVTEPKEIAYWRKHPNLHGWMRRLWESRGNTGDFNGDELELTWEDLDRLEHDIQTGAVADIDERGFFFGNPCDDVYREQDLEFIKKARAELFLGLRVFYNSSW